MRGRPSPIKIPAGIFSDETERGTAGRWKDGDKIRFFSNNMPEKIGGWILSSVGEIDSEQVIFEYDQNPVSRPAARVRYAVSGYAAGAASITLDQSIGASEEGRIDDGDPVWLFDDSLVGGMGGRTLTGTIGNYTATASANITASRGNAVFIRYTAEFTGLNGATIVDGGQAGSVILTLGTPVTRYLTAGSLVRIFLASGAEFHTRLENNLVSGATQITIEDALPEAARAAVDGGAVQIMPVGTHIHRNESTTVVAYVIRFLANSPSASTSLLFTRPLPASVTANQIDVRVFQLTFADGEHFDGVGSILTLDISPVTAFASLSGNGTTVSQGLVFLPEFYQEFERYVGQVRAVHDWKDLDDQQWMSFGTDKKLYVVNNGQLFDITPVRATAILTDPFATTNASFEVVVTDVAHGAQVGDYVRFSGATLVGSLDMNDEFPIVEVIDADNYVVLNEEFATATTTGGGTVNVEYDISAGLEDSSEVEGWGTGGYGEGPYGIGTAGGGIQQKLRIWSLDNFGEDLLASPLGGALYHWDRSAGPNTRAVVVPEAPATIQRMMVSPQGRHVIALGAGTGNYVSPGDPDSLFIRWSDSEDFTSWIPTTTNAAGDLRLDKGSEIITAIESRGEIFINTDESLHAMQHLGNEFVFGLRHLGQSVSIIGPNAEVDVNGVVFFMAVDDFIIYDGVISVMPCDVHSHVFDDFNTSQGYKVFCSVNRAFNEIWWFYPSLESEEPDRYVKFNYLLKVWDYGTMSRTAFHDKSRFINAPYGFDSGLIWQHETGTDETDTDGILRPMVAYIESGDLEVTEGGDQEANVGALVPDFKTLTGEIELRVSGKRDPQGDATTDRLVRGPFIVNSATKRVPGIRLKARQVSFIVRSDQLGDHWRMGTWKVEARARGRRNARG